jgi:hypothetical protein
MLTEQHVRETIERHIAENDKRINSLMQPDAHTADLVIVEKLKIANGALRLVLHDLRLCDCPAEAYSQVKKG